MTDQYLSLSKGNKRLVWFGYLAYLFWVFFLDGWDSVLEDPIERIWNNAFFMIAVILLLYWIIIFLVLWVIDGFND